MIDKNFTTAINILNKYQIDYWVCHGTLLGIYRDNKIIDWDNDVDIAIFDDNTTRKKIKEYFKKEKFKKKEKYFDDDGLITFEREGGKDIDINLYNISKVNKNLIFVNWYLPKNIFFKFIDLISHASDYKGKYTKLISKLSIFEDLFLKVKKFFILKKFFFKKIGYEHPYDFISKKKKINFNNLQIFIPQEPAKYLEYIYGKDWKIPKKNFTWYKDSPAVSEKNNDI